MSSASEHQPTDGGARCRVAPPVVTTVAVLGVVALVVVPAFASVTRTTIKPAAAFDPTATLVSSGRQLRASGPAPTCSKSDNVLLTVTMVQHGVTARGRWSKHNCTGGPQHWHVLLTTARGQSLKPGQAIGHGKAVITEHGRAVATVRWSRSVKLLSA